MSIEQEIIDSSLMSLKVLPSKYDYIEYDEIAKYQQGLIKSQIEKLTSDIESLYPGRSSSLALTKLEESYMWIGKAIRDGVIARKNLSAS